MTSTRNARSAATRQRILGAAHELFVTQGYRSTSLRDIAAAASVSHPGLLGHFPSKDALLAEVVARFEQDNADVFDLAVAAAEPGALMFSELAARNATTPGYLELFAALTGEASATGHPSHERMRERYANMRALTMDALQDAVDLGVIAPDRDVAAETTRAIAGWDGLQLIAQYLPDRVDVVDMLGEREGLWATPVGWRASDETDPRPEGAGPLPELSVSSMGDDDLSGYATGRRRRARILADAMQLFARSGYGDTSLSDIASVVGVSKSTLLHHFPTKEALLSAVLIQRDRAIRGHGEETATARAADVLRGMPEGAQRNATDEPGLIEVYAVLSCEAVPASHPAHDYFTDRFRRSIDYFTEMFRLAQLDGDLPEHRDPEREAIWLIALWDGLQYQWLYDRKAVDVAEQLRAHLDDVLPAH
ncbi:HTH-type transcriptional regulator RutR [Microbacterium hydrocarbonoxydans]|uniref:HTH-type transcriptional regulator RutR n=1 Tax=Microbacterium hydrocarbonoxydans TaxID=273678 RepID=A0A0M2HVU0_9MICO|nr:TetR/AcrR family transcriptional regulator [Microbacterium hydrocarbonoxydans]KJL48568.1 HTH-type transcriptional regulator RutR [Microbacterium hydrocarbonoxydans]